MSAEQQDQSQVDIGRVVDITAEPMYLSEIARKLNSAFDTDRYSVDLVAQAASVLAERDGITFTDVGYSDNEGQKVGSMHYSQTDSGGREETKEWSEYTIIHNENPNLDDVEQEIRDISNPSVSVKDKVAVIDILSGRGNFVSRAAENIMQDAMERQFREYSNIEYGDYNDPGIDFTVEDDDRRNFGISVEVSTRWENPIGNPYINAKEDASLDEDFDVAVLAPSFRDEVLNQYEQVGSNEWHTDPEGEITHLHKVPTDRSVVHRPFANSPPDDDFDPGGGFPVIVPDGERVRNRIGNMGHVGDDYPVIDTKSTGFRDALESVERDFRLITESGYRAQLREAVEPLLHEFAKPYKIEQYLIDTYWDKGMTTDEIGELVGVSGRTIRDWLSDKKWDIVTRGTNTPLSDETVEIWLRMYEGEEPFPRQFTGYEIQALYNRRPLFTLDDWEEWYNTDEDLRDALIRQSDGPLSQIGYTLMVGVNERIFPSYSFIINRLRREGVDIREGFVGNSGSVTPTGLALRYMINSSVGDLTNDSEPDGTDTVDMRSSLEVEVGEWFSENQIPYAYEPFVVPSVLANTSTEFESLSELVKQGDRGELLARWRRIYGKHELDSQGDVGVEEGYDRCDVEVIVPYFVTYRSAGRGEKTLEWDGWRNWDHIIELGGLYGLGIQNEWDSWYRVKGVAYKELALKALGLWSQSYFLIPDNGEIPDGVRNDDHYIVLNPTQTDAGLDVMSQIPGLSV